LGIFNRARRASGESHNSLAGSQRQRIQPDKRENVSVLPLRYFSQAFLELRKEA